MTTGAPGDVQYREGYVLDLKDTKRHDNARGCQSLDMAHDWFSMAVIMALHAPSSPSDGRAEAASSSSTSLVTFNKEEKLTENVRSSKIEEFLALSDEYKFAKLKFQYGENTSQASLADSPECSGNECVRGKKRKREE